MNKNHPLMQMARMAKRNGYPKKNVAINLKPEYQKFIPQIEAEYERFEPRKKACNT